MTTIVTVSPGACGLKTVITAVNEGDRVRISIESECPMVREWASKLPPLTAKDVLKSPFKSNIVYQIAGGHSTCPVPCATLKAAEAELGLAVKRDVKIEFTE